MIDLLAQADGGGGGGIMGMIFMIIYLAVIVGIVAGVWKTFTKAGQPGWGALIPIYNLYLLIKIAGRPGWWILLFFIPLINLIIGFVVAKDIAENFGKGIGFTLGLFFLPMIFYPILGFGSAQYQGS